MVEVVVAAVSVVVVVAVVTVMTQPSRHSIWQHSNGIVCQCLPRMHGIDGMHARPCTQLRVL